MDLVELLGERRLLGIVRGSDPDAAVRAVCTLVDAGVEVVEVSLSGVDGLGVVGRCRAALGDQAALGAGTVITARDAARAVDAGAAFVVSPAVTEGARAAAEDGLPVLCGALTPTEVLAAAALGAFAVKIFPAFLHGPAYIGALREPFPELRFVPVGGVDAASVPDYIAAGAYAVGVGSPLVGDAAAGGSLAGLQARAAQYRRAVAVEGSA